MINDPTDPYAGETPPPPSDPGDAEVEGWWRVIEGVWYYITNPLPKTE